MVRVLTEREKEIIEKKMKGISLTQNESNILSKVIRPKLKEICKINAEMVLGRIEYNQISKSIENKIKKIILENIDNVEALILHGSAVQTNYQEYNDIDIIIAVKKILKEETKRKLIKKIEKEGRWNKLKLDIQIYSKESIINQYSNNPSLIYQLKDSKIIYGNIEIPKKIELTPLSLKMKLDWSEGLEEDSSGREIYYSIRNALLVLLLINKRVDNYQLNYNLICLLGKDMLKKLKDNSASKDEKNLALNYLSLLTRNIENQLKNSKWEKIEIENH
ncbi:MAG: nucleotidyltransferase domain-containing protein [Nanoarchaeota archaeon]